MTRHGLRGAGADAFVNQSALQNLHHDQNERPRRAVTVLIYLSDAASDGLKGGATSYPCVHSREPRPPHPAATSSAANATHSASSMRVRLCERLRNAFESGERFLSTSSLHEHIPCFDAEAASAASDDCLLPPSSAGGGWGLRVAPERGTALLFLSADPTDGRALAETAWH